MQSALAATVLYRTAHSSGQLSQLWVGRGKAKPPLAAHPVGARPCLCPGPGCHRTLPNGAFRWLPWAMDVGQARRSRGLQDRSLPWLTPNADQKNLIRRSHPGSLRPVRARQPSYSTERCIPMADMARGGLEPGGGNASHPPWPRALAATVLYLTKKASYNHIRRPLPGSPA